MAINDQGVNHKIFKAVVVALNDENFNSAQAVTVGTRKVALRCHVIIMSVDRRRVYRSVR